MKTPTVARYTPPPGTITKEAVRAILNISDSTLSRMLHRGALKTVNTVLRKPLLFNEATIRALASGQSEARVLTVSEAKGRRAAS